MTGHRIGWLGLASITICLAACPGDDSTGDTANTTFPPATDGGGDNSTGAQGTTTDTPEPTAGDMGSTGTPDPTTGEPPPSCDPPCSADQQCVGGTCIGGGDTGAAECGTNVSTMNAACDNCSHANCCPEVQGCFGDETVMMNTPCLDLNNCIAMNCQMAMDVMGLQDCIDMSCPELVGELNNWLAFNNCLFMNCAAECGA